jgi:hypothetical protein
MSQPTVSFPPTKLGCPAHCACQIPGFAGTPFRAALVAVEHRLVCFQVQQGRRVVLVSEVLRALPGASPQHNVNAGNILGIFRLLSRSRSFLAWTGPRSHGTRLDRACGFYVVTPTLSGLPPPNCSSYFDTDGSGEVCRGRTDSDGVRHGLLEQDACRRVLLLFGGSSLKCSITSANNCWYKDLFCVWAQGLLLSLGHLEVYPRHLSYTGSEIIDPNFGPASPSGASLHILRLFLGNGASSGLTLVGIFQHWASLILIGPAPCSLLKAGCFAEIGADPGLDFVF